MKKIAILTAAIFLFACQTVNQENTSSPNNETVTKQQNNTSLIIGGVETVYVPPFDIPFQARIDTGAETSSIDAQDIKPFERDGEKWVSFTITNKKNSQKYLFEKPIVRKTLCCTLRYKNGRRDYIYRIHIK